MRYSTLGPPRKVTDEVIARLRDWKPFHQLAKELGLSTGHASKLRSGYYRHKMRSP